MRPHSLSFSTALLVFIVTVASIADSASAQTARPDGTVADSASSVTLAVWPTEQISSPVASSSNLNPVTSIHYGDSITFCHGVTKSENCYVNRIASYFGISEVVDLGVSGAQACDVAQLEGFKYDSPALGTGQPIRTVMVGTNDVNREGSGPYEATFNLCDQALLAWLGTPIESKLAGASVFSEATGSCAVDQTFPVVSGILCQSPGSAIPFTVTTTGKPIYLWYRIIDGDTGTFSYTVDGGAPVTLATSPATPIGSAWTGSESVALARIVTTAGTHAVNFTQLTSGSMAILAIATPSEAPLSDLPSIFVASVPNQLNGSRKLSIDQYTADVRNNIRVLVGDGLNLVYIPVAQYLTANTAASDMYDNIHPNDTGHAELFTAFLTSIESLWPPRFGPHSPIAMSAAVLSPVGGTAAGGSVDFFADAERLGSAPLVAGLATLNPPSPLPVGVHNISATYSGDATYASTTSPDVQTTITGQATVTSLMNSTNTAVYGDAVTFTGQVTSGGKPVVKGNVSLAINGQVLETTPVDGQGEARFVSSNLSSGIDSVVATFEPVDNFGISSSAAVDVTVLPLTTSTVLSSSTSSTYPGVDVLLTAKVVAEGKPVTGGSVTFASLAGPLGTSAVNGDGAATLHLASLPLGSYSLTAAYAQYGNFGPSTSPAVPLSIVLRPDFSLSVSPTLLAVANGQTTTASLLVMPENGFKETLTYSVSGLPTGVRCSFGTPVTQTDGSILLPISISTQISEPKRRILISGLGFAIGFVFLIRGGRKIRKKRLLKTARLFSIVTVSLGILPLLSSCGSPRVIPDVNGTLVLTAKSESNISHSASLSMTISFR